MMENNTIKNNFESNIIFLQKEGMEILKLCANGDIYVRGKLVENDKEVVEGLREFLKSQNF